MTSEQQHQVESKRSRQSCPDLNIYNLENKEMLSKKISLETIQNLLSQKKFVKDMLRGNPEFVKIVSEEVKVELSEEIKGELL